MTTSAADTSLGTMQGATGRIGPNAIVRVGEALEHALGGATTASVFRTAGLSRYLASPPHDMVDEHEVIALHRALRAETGPVKARLVLRDAGSRTGDYLLANRIPRLAHRVLRALPTGLAARMLAGAIGRNAWTFAGSGEFRAERGPPLRLSIGHCPLCRDVGESASADCVYYAATFERLFRALVDPRIRVVETQCQAHGDPACAFDVVTPQERA